VSGGEICHSLLKREGVDIANYLMTHYKGKYRILVEYDKNTNQFPRKLDGTYEDIDCFISCQKGVRIYYYGHSILQAYIPSLQRGHNIIKAIKELENSHTRYSVNDKNKTQDIDKNSKNLSIKSDFQGENIVHNIEEGDSEVLFCFHSKYMEQLEPYLKPKTSGASISPFSSKNLPKNKSYKISDEDLTMYKSIVENIPQNQMISIVHITKFFLQSLATKKNPMDKIKADMALKGLKNKEYIHSIGKWNDYIKYLQKELK